MQKEVSKAICMYIYIHISNFLVVCVYSVGERCGGGGGRGQQCGEQAGLQRAVHPPPAGPAQGLPDRERESVCGDACIYNVMEMCIIII